MTYSTHCLIKSELHWTMLCVQHNTWLLPFSSYTPEWSNNRDFSSSTQILIGQSGIPSQSVAMRNWLVCCWLAVCCLGNMTSRRQVWGLPGGASLETACRCVRPNDQDSIISFMGTRNNILSGCLATWQNVLLLHWLAPLAFAVQFIRRLFSIMYCG